MLSPCPTNNVLFGTAADSRSAAVQGCPLISATGGDRSGDGGDTGAVQHAVVPAKIPLQIPPSHSNRFLQRDRPVFEKNSISR